jgi:hypothetical protein
VGDGGFEIRDSNQFQKHFGTKTNPQVIENIRKVSGIGQNNPNLGHSRGENGKKRKNGYPLRTHWNLFSGAGDPIMSAPDCTDERVVGDGRRG